MARSSLALAASMLAAVNLLPPDASAQGGSPRGDLVHFAGVQGALDGRLPAGAEAQTRQALANLERLLGAAGLDLARVVEVRIALADARNYPAVDKVFRERFPAMPPATTAFEAELSAPGVEVELIAVAARAGIALAPVAPASWPKPTGYFSRAVRAGDTLLLAGQVGYDPATGQTAEGVGAQAERALTNIRQLVEAGGLTLKDVVACKVFLADPRDFAALNAAWRAVFAAEPPVRETVGAKLAAEEFKIEIQCTAIAGGRRVVEPAGHVAGAPYSPAIAAGGRLFTSGRVARGKDGWPSGVEAQARTILAQLRADLAAAGLEPRDVVDATVFVTDQRSAALIDGPWREFFGDHQPTRSLTGAPLMTPEALVEISFVADLRPAAP